MNNTLTALKLYEAVYDKARGENIPESKEEQVKDIMEYAEWVFDTTVNVEVATAIANAHTNYNAATWGDNGNGEHSHNYYIHIESVLRDIVLKQYAS